MLNEVVISTLRCPENQASLSLADAQTIAALNNAQDKKQLRNRAGRLVEARFDGGLVRAGGEVLYPIVNQIPLLLVDEAILIGQLQLDRNIQ